VLVSLKWPWGRRKFLRGGLPEKRCLEIQNDYAGKRGSYANSIIMDSKFPKLPVRNIANTRIGYEVYSSGRIAPHPPKPSLVLHRGHR